MTICLFTASAQTEKERFAISGNTDMSLIFAKTSLVVDSAAGEKQTNPNVSLDQGIQYSYNHLKNTYGISEFTYRQQALGFLAGLSI